MKKLITITAIVLASSLVHAADAEHSDKTTVDHSKNPVTGTETTTKKHTKKMKNDHGASAEVTTKEKTKVKKDGTVTKETTTESESANK